MIFRLIETRMRKAIIKYCGLFLVCLLELETGFRLKWNQYRAMFMKRFLNSKRDKKAIITQLVLPIIMVVFGLLLITTIPPRENDPPRVLKLSNLSVDGVHTKAFFADYRNMSSSKKTATFEVREIHVLISLHLSLY